MIEGIADEDNDFDSLPRFADPSAVEVKLLGIALTGNTASDDGGGLSATPASQGATTAVIITEGTRVISNKAENGGGIHMSSMLEDYQGVGEQVTIEIADDCVIAKNVAGLRGGGVYAEGYFGASCVISDSVSINGNSAASSDEDTSTEGGGVYVKGSQVVATSMNMTVEADVTLTMSDDIFVKLATGKIAPQVAFIQGKLKIQGNIALSMKLTPVLKAAQPKAKL